MNVKKYVVVTIVKCLVLLVGLTILMGAKVAHADDDMPGVVADIAVPGAEFPTSVGVNPATGYAYIVNRGGDDTWSDGSSNSSILIVRGTEVISRIDLGKPRYGDLWKEGYPPLIDVEADPTTDYVYLSDGLILSGTEVITEVGISGIDVEVNPTTGYVYVVGEEVSYILEGTEIVTTVAVPAYAVAADQTSGYVYLAGPETAILSGTEVITMLTELTGTVAVAVDQGTSHTYVAGQGVTVISGTEVVTTIAPELRWAPFVPPFGITRMTVHPHTGDLYIASNLSGGSYSGDSVYLTVIRDRAIVTNVLITSGPQVGGLEIDPVTGYVYVTGGEYEMSGTLAIISGTEVISNPFPAGYAPRYMDVNPVTGDIYVVDAYQGATILRGLEAVGHIPPDHHPRAVVVNPINGYAYILHGNSDSITILDGTQVITTLTPIGDYPCTVPLVLYTLTDLPHGIAVNPRTGYVYATHMGLFLESHVVVISGTRTIAAVPLTNGGVPMGIGVSRFTGYVYVSQVASWPEGGVISVISGTTVIASWNTAYHSNNIAVSPQTGYVYAPGCCIISGTEVIGDLEGEEYRNNIVGVNPTTGYVYVANGGYGSTNVSVISGTEVITSLVVDIGYRIADLAVNSTTGYVYVVGWGNKTAVISGTEYITNINVGGAWNGVGINQSSNYVYIGNGENIAVVRDTIVIGEIPVDGIPAAIAADPKRGLVYVGNFNDENGRGSITVLREPPVEKPYRIYLPLILKSLH